MSLFRQTGHQVKTNVINLILSYKGKGLFGFFVYFGGGGSNTVFVSLYSVTVDFNSNAEDMIEFL